ncbi:MAG: beta-N-acetylhexosaminidase [Burkholderiales bacterium]
MSAAPGPAIIDVVGSTLTDGDRSRLRHRSTGGAILFARNYENPRQLRALVSEIRGLRSDLLLCVDHEGGRVQRFRAGFSPLPPMRRLGEMWDGDRGAACDAALAAGLVVAAELAAHGLDFSFAPVLDLDYGSSSVIGDRAFHSDPLAVGELAAAFVRGLGQGGMAAVGKHFPGHGFASADSHVDVPRDERPLQQILARDVAPYEPAIAAGLAAVMPAHVIYTHADSEPAGYSRFWLQDILRNRLGFTGMIFSDDLSMEGAGTAGSIPERARAALAAGCDMVLLCNDPSGQDRLLDALGDIGPAPVELVARMRARHYEDRRTEVAYLKAVQALSRLA